MRLMHYILLWIALYFIVNDINWKHSFCVLLKLFVDLSSTKYAVHIATDCTNISYVERLYGCRVSIFILLTTNQRIGTHPTFLYTSDTSLNTFSDDSPFIWDKSFNELSIKQGLIFM